MISIGRMRRMCQCVMIDLRSILINTDDTYVGSDDLRRGYTATPRSCRQDTCCCILPHITQQHVYSPHTLLYTQAYSIYTSSSCNTHSSRSGYNYHSTSVRLRFDDSTAIRPRCDHSTTYNQKLTMIIFLAVVKRPAASRT